MILDNGNINSTTLNSLSDSILNQVENVMPIEFGIQSEYNFLEDDVKLPQSLKLIDLYNGEIPVELRDIVHTFVHSKVSDSIESVLSSYYPPTGYIDWHTNSNKIGYNLILTYSNEGDSFFEYVNPTTLEVVQLKDSVGWSYKILKWGKNENKIWHRAVSNCHRITFTFFSNNQQDLINLKNSL